MILHVRRMREEMSSIFVGQWVRVFPSRRWLYGVCLRWYFALSLKNDGETHNPSWTYQTAQSCSLSFTLNQQVLWQQVLWQQLRCSHKKWLPEFNIALPRTPLDQHIFPFRLGRSGAVSESFLMSNDQTYWANRTLWNSFSWDLHRKGVLPDRQDFCNRFHGSLKRGR